MKFLSLGEVHAALLDILTEFDRVCKKHNLTYSLAYGTLIGAVRHEGFIPWDDDVDVVMPRPDYEKLYALVKSGEIQFNEHFSLSEDRGKKALYPFMKLMDDRFGLKSWSHREVPYLYIDIFPVDGAPAEPKALKKLYKKRFRYDVLRVLALWYVLEKKWTLLFRFIGLPAYLVGACYGTARAARKATEASIVYDFDQCEKSGVFCFGIAEWELEREKFIETIELPFEGRYFSVIAAYDEWLTKTYGNYMQLPPENKRVTHNLQIYRREEKKK